MKTAILLGLLVALAGGHNLLAALGGYDSESASSSSADTTRVSARDGNTAPPTVVVQSERQDDWTLTRRVREGMMKNNALVTTAMSVKIITRSSVVTLRGPVKSDKEKAEVVAIAESTDGVKRVDDQLQIAFR